MRLRASDDGASIPKSFIRELKRISPQLEVRFYRFFPMPGGQGRPLMTRDSYEEVELQPVPMPRFYVYSVEPSGKAHLVTIVQNEDGSFRPLDARVTKALESDALRVLGLKKLLQQNEEALAAKQTNARKQAWERNRRFAEENAGKLREAASNPSEQVRQERDAKIYSTHRGQAGTVPLTPEDKGWVS